MDLSYCFEIFLYIKMFDNFSGEEAEKVAFFAVEIFLRIYVYM